MHKAYYDEYFSLERNHWFFSARAAVIISHLESILHRSERLKILNVGAATGGSSQWLERFGEVKSLEYDEECCKLTQAKLAIDIQVGSVLELPFDDESFDLVCAFDVIEHVDDDSLAVQEMQRVCKDGGLVCVTVPAFMFLWSYHDIANHHFRRYNRAQMLRLFSRVGDVLFCSYFNFWLFFPICLFRMSSRWLGLRHGTAAHSGSDCSVLNGSKVIGCFLKSVLSSESAFIRRKLKFPFGVSIIASWRKG